MVILMKNENKVNLIIVIVVIILVGGLAFFFLSKNMQTDGVKNINISELREKINNKDSFMLVITQDGCTHCKAYLPTIRKIANQYNLTFYDISQTGLNEEDKTFLKNVANIDGTPTTVFIENGEEKTTTNRLVGNVPEYRVIEKLKALGYINE